MSAVGAVLECVDCGQKKWWPGDEFDDQPIEAWWESKGKRCQDCRRRAARAPHRVGTAGRRHDAAVAGRVLPGRVPRLGSRRREVYEVIRAAGRRGVTYEELCEQLGRSYSVTGPRVRELVRDGLVLRSGDQRIGSSGAAQDVWIHAGAVRAVEATQ